MKKFYYSMVALLFLAISLTPEEAEAQNKKQSAARAKAMKAAAKTRRDPYTATYLEKDSDGDGIPDGRDKCPHTPRGEKVTPFGCPIDTDFDGIYDYEDACVNEPGPKENQGCPWGDKDGDGIYDKDDRCPDVAGIAKFFGCPDSDKDGLPDHEDNCPKEYGPKENRGCPYGDRDGDGVTDDRDLCPDVPGVAHNRGCPEQKKEVADVLKKAFDNLLFETAKDVIMSSSFASLDELAKVMKKYPTSELYLEGHTDDVGDDDANQTLSENRARSVKNYLVKKGIAEHRIHSQGFGESRPKADNGNEEGRRLNRRVEMNIIYK